MAIKTLSLITMLGPFLLLAVNANAQQKDLRTVRVNVFRIDAAMVVARARGLFATEGIDANITQTPNSTAQMRGISKGTFDIAATAFDNVLAWSGKEGAEIVAIAQVSDRTVLPVFVRQEIRDWGDLKGWIRASQKRKFVRPRVPQCRGCSTTPWLPVSVGLGSDQPIVLGR